MLTHAESHAAPFPHVRCDNALTAHQCEVLEAHFDGPGWQLKDDGFYTCFIRDITDALPAGLFEGLVTRMATLTGLPLLDRLQVTAQRMDPGQRVGVHSDEPLAGYEIARLVVPLNHDWRPEHGGQLTLHETRDGPAVAAHLPTYNHGFAFVLHADSHHAVRQVTQVRRTVVLHFWHQGNPPELADEVASLFAAPSFAALPASLAPMATEAEAALPEEVTFRAGLAALAVQRWGHDDAAVQAAYRFSAFGEGEGALLRRADFFARLYSEPFDPEVWRGLTSDEDVTG